MNWASAAEKKITPKEFVTNVAEVPSKVSNHIKNEWEDIKVYQKNNCHLKNMNHDHVFLDYVLFCMC